jgi:hypothetical protein
VTELKVKIIETKVGDGGESGAYGEENLQDLEDAINDECSLLEEKGNTIIEVQFVRKGFTVILYEPRHRRPERD